MALSKYDENKNLWQARGRLYDINGNFIRQYKKIGFTSRREAKAYEDELIKNVKSDKKLPFEELSKHYLQFYKSHNKFSSYRSTENAVNLHILPFFMSYDVFLIKPKDILDWKINIQNTNNYSVAYLNKIWAQLVAIFNHSVKYFDLDKSPTDKIGSFKSGEVKKEMQFWTIDDFKKFVKSIKDPMHELFFHTLFYTGVRKGEAQGLQWSDIDFDKRQMKISKTWQNIGNGNYGLTSPKTKNANRTIIIDNKTLEKLKLRLSEVEKIKGFSNDFFIFGDTKPLSTSQISVIFNNYLDICEVKRIRIHDFRHSHVSLLISLGSNILFVTKRLGHASAKETFDTYSHLYPDEEITIIEKIEKLQNGSKMGQDK